MGKLTGEQQANLSEELIAKAMQCETPEELVELAKAEGYNLTLEEAQAYLDELDDFELDSQQLKAVDGESGCWGDCNSYCVDCDDDCGADCSVRHDYKLLIPFKEEFL